MRRKETEKFQTQTCYIQEALSTKWLTGLGGLVDDNAQDGCCMIMKPTHMKVTET